MPQTIRWPTIVASLWMTSTPAIAGQPFEGRWSENPLWCSPKHEGLVDEQPITITAKRIDLWVSSCRIDKITKVGPDLRLQTMCREEGEMEARSKDPETFTLSLKGDRMKISTNRASWDLQRCPPVNAPDTVYIEQSWGHTEKCPTCWLKSNSCSGIFLTRPQIC